MAVIAAANPEMEALAIAVAMREAQNQNISAALVTPDRALARRVLSALGRWNLVFNDSGGDSLMDTRAGFFARVAAAVTEQFAASITAGVDETSAVPARPRARAERTLADLEMALLRGTRPPAGLDGLHRTRSISRGADKTSEQRDPSLHRAEPRAELRSIDSITSRP